MARRPCLRQIERPSERASKLERLLRFRPSLPQLPSDSYLSFVESDETHAAPKYACMHAVTAKRKRPIMGPQRGISTDIYLDEYAGAHLQVERILVAFQLQQSLLHVRQPLERVVGLRPVEERSRMY